MALSIEKVCFIKIKLHSITLLLGEVMSTSFSEYQDGLMGFPGGSAGKQSACNSGDPSLIPELGRSHGEAIGYPLQYSWLENPMDRGAWQVTVHGVAKSRT